MPASEDELGVAEVIHDSLAHHTPSHAATSPITAMKAILPGPSRATPSSTSARKGKQALPRNAMRGYRDGLNTRVEKCASLGASSRPMLPSKRGEEQRQ
jgi:hypothetical protein